ncbi:hypothetical protein [Petrotoga mobilis]|uniref:hypothetical protein n=1 Tax=Petrotoga mobilis TaxID=69499 RepID=UPI0002D4E51F|nr:hypothetical protein [Petrotoga mobilis]
MKAITAEIGGKKKGIKIVLSNNLEMIPSFLETKYAGIKVIANDKTDERID